MAERGARWLLAGVPAGFLGRAAAVLGTGPPWCLGRDFYFRAVVSTLGAGGRRWRHEGRRGQGVPGLKMASGGAS